MSLIEADAGVKARSGPILQLVGVRKTFGHFPTDRHRRSARHGRRDQESRRPFFLCAQHEPQLGGESPPRELVAATPSEPQGGSIPGREAGAERSGERNRESTNRNRIRGAADQGERASDREALATKGMRRRSGDCAVKVVVLTWGDLALRLKGRRWKAEREVSRGRSSRVEAGQGGSPKGPEGFGKAKGRTEGRATRP